MALHLPLDSEGFDPSSLSCVRQRLANHGEGRHAFDRFVAVGRRGDFILDKVSLLTNTSWDIGGGAFQDT